jgi:hypothetical protein
VRDVRVSRFCGMTRLLRSAFCGMSGRCNVARCPVCSGATFAGCRSLSDPRDVLSVQTLILRVVPPVQKCAMTAAFGINYPARCRAVYRRGMSSANRKPGSDFAPANPARGFLKMSPRLASRFADNANNPTLNSG